jgi:hypothetical protein
MSSVPPSVKGATMASFMKFIRESLPPDTQAALMQSVPEEYRVQLMRPTILATSLFPMSLLNAMNLEGARLTGQPPASFARRAGRSLAAQAVKGVYRLFARVLTPDSLLSRAASMWSAMNTAGTMSVELQSANQAKLKLDYPLADPILCARLEGWMEQMAELTGAIPSVTHIRCTSKGAPTCEWTIKW